MYKYQKACGKELEMDGWEKTNLLAIQGRRMAGSPHSEKKEEPFITRNVEVQKDSQDPTAFHTCPFS